jgi:5-hydroxyisourate hydrolase-like protein (transthyretin family)
MLKDLVLRLRYIGVMPQVGYVEYGFRIENKDKGFQQIVLTIEDHFFRKNDLKLQEAPDLCYQKVLMDLDNQKADSHVPLRVLPVTALDIAHYRDLHPTTKLRKLSRRDTK